MCGRYAINFEEDIYERFGTVKGKLSFGENLNASPGQELPVVVIRKGKRIIELVRWGFTVKWSDDKKTRLINTRAESVSQKSIFEKGWKTNRCIVPANGFYEWKKSDGKQPYYFALTNNKYIGMAGIINIDNDGPGFTIITTHANSEVSKVHDRMPVILGVKSSEEDWLNYETKERDLLDILVPLEESKMFTRRVTINK